MARHVDSSTPSRQQLRSLLGATPDIDLVRRRISELRYRNRAIASIVGATGLAPLLPLADDEAVARLRTLCNQGPAVILTWHLGPVLGLATIMARGGIPGLVIRTGFFYEAPKGIDFAYVSGGIHDRASTLLRAVNRLRDGGVVVIAADGPDVSETMSVTCFDREYGLARGPFAMSRLAGVPIVSVVPFWNARGAIDVVVGPPLASLHAEGRSEVSERAAADSAAAWFESYVAGSPGELWVYTIRRLLVRG